MSNTGKRYSEETKSMIIKMYREEHRSVNSLANKYGIPSPTIARWIKLATPIDLPNGETVTTKEFNALQKENARLKGLRRNWTF
ncbi:transposase [uncultured Secundilactobacillus sp.]|uniref:transposase n=1 Tax=uncultured Secundilactobacillus sp. TaxID=2813935 RepID=UPI002588376E|nr:transposase [uncultured Secundilactobacillus sp.]